MNFGTKRLAHVHYRALPIASKAIEGLPEIQAKHDGLCKDSGIKRELYTPYNPQQNVIASKAVEGLPKIQEKHDGVCKGCAKGKNKKKTFPSSERKEKGILEIIHSDVCGPMSSSSLSVNFSYA